MSTSTGTYSGDLSVTDTWHALQNDANAVLVDVRTTMEWDTIGVPDLSSLGKDVIFIEWQTYPSMSVNPAFTGILTSELQKRGRGSDAPIYFLCRSGVRSQSAAMAATDAGYSSTYNVSGGFEGPPGPDGRRGTVDGWQAADLPWIRK